MALILGRSLRAAMESTVGTPVTPTRIMYQNTAEHIQGVPTIRPAEQRASWEQFYRSAPGPETNQVNRSGSVTFDDVIHDLATHVKGVVSGSLTDTSAYTWTFLPNAGLVDDTKSLTMEFAYADSIASSPGVRIPGLRGNELTVTWDKPSGDVTFSSSMLSAFAGTDITAFTGSLTDRTGLQPVTAVNSQVYIDPTTIGTTQDPEIQNISWHVTNGYNSLFTLDNTNAARRNARTAGRIWELTALRYFANNTERARYFDKAVRKVRVKTVSSVLAGAATAFYTLQLDCYGVWEELTGAESNGFGMHNMILRPVYDVTSGSSFNWSVINKTAALS